MNLPAANRIEQAQIEAIRARRRFASALGALQLRLRPETLASNAWDGVVEKSSEMADEALQKVKARPVAVSSAIAAFALYLAREPIWRGVSGLFSRSGEEDGLVTTRLENKDGRFDIEAPTITATGP